MVSDQVLRELRRACDCVVGRIQLTGLGRSSRVSLTPT